MSALERQISKYIFKNLWGLIYSKCFLTPESFTQTYFPNCTKQKKNTDMRTGIVCLLHKYVTQDKLFSFQKTSMGTWSPCMSANAFNCHHS